MRQSDSRIMRLGRRSDASRNGHYHVVLDNESAAWDGQRIVVTSIQLEG
jgi:hypothetical protein